MLLKTLKFNPREPSQPDAELVEKLAIGLPLGTPERKATTINY